MFLNLTPHTVAIVVDGETISLPSSGIARVRTLETPAGDIEGIPTIKRTFGKVQGIPDPEEGVTIIVSSMVLSAMEENRSDVVAPDTGPTAIRDEQGRIQAVTRLVKK